MKFKDYLTESLKKEESESLNDLEKTIRKEMKNNKSGMFNIETNYDTIDYYEQLIDKDRKVFDKKLLIRFKGELKKIDLEVDEFANSLWKVRITK